MLHSGGVPGAAVAQAMPIMPGADVVPMLQ